MTALLRYAAGLLCLLFAAACTTPQPPPATTVPSPSAITQPGACHYQADGAMPDPACNPGWWNPAVTQATIGTTICLSGWTATIRPPSSYTDHLKLVDLRAYGQPTDNLRDWELDHLNPLEAGGHPTDPRNLWPQPHAIALVKDQAEHRLHSDICTGRKTLAAAQALWSAGWQQYR